MSVELNFEKEKDLRQHILYFKHQDATYENLMLSFSIDPDTAGVVDRINILQDNEVLFYVVELTTMRNNETKIVIERHSTKPGHGIYVATLYVKYGIFALAHHEVSKDIDKLIRAFIPEDYDSVVHCVGGKLRGSVVA